MYLQTSRHTAIVNKATQLRGEGLYMLDYHLNWLQYAKARRNTMHDAARVSCRYDGTEQLRATYIGFAKEAHKSVLLHLRELEQVLRSKGVNYA